MDLKWLKFGPRGYLRSVDRVLLTVSVQGHSGVMCWISSFCQDYVVTSATWLLLTSVITWLSVVLIWQSDQADYQGPWASCHPVWAVLADHASDHAVILGAGAVPSCVLVSGSSLRGLPLPFKRYLSAPPTYTSQFFWGGGGGGRVAVNGLSDVNRVDQGGFGWAPPPPPPHPLVITKPGGQTPPPPPRLVKAPR